MKTFTRISSVLALAIAVCWGSMLKAQNTCDSPAIITCGQTVFGSTEGVPNDNATSGAITCDGFDVETASGQQWYSFTPPADGTFIFTLDNPNTTWDTKVHVYTGTCGDLDCVTADDDAGVGPGSGASSVCTWDGI